MELSREIIHIAFSIGIIAGLIKCFFGYRIFKFILGCFGFILGGVAAGFEGYAIRRRKSLPCWRALWGALSFNTALFQKTEKNTQSPAPLDG